MGITHNLRRTQDLRKIESVNWVQKMKELLDGRSLRSIEKAAGVPLNTLAGKKKLKTAPNVLYSIRIARALEVPAEWLFDDKQDCPPPRAADVRRRRNEKAMLNYARDQLHILLMLVDDACAHGLPDRRAANAKSEAARKAAVADEAQAAAASGRRGRKGSRRRKKGGDG